MRVIVTGAASGIGRATARLLAAAGADITAIDRTPCPEAARWIAADLSVPSEIAGIAVEGTYDALVNAAGLPPRTGNAEAVLSVNWFGLRELTARLIPSLASGGAIVSLASLAGARWHDNLDQIGALMRLSGPEALPDFIATQGIDPVRAYDLSKEAVIVWTKQQTAPLLGRGLRANTVSPGPVETPILGDFVAAFGQRARDGIAATGGAGSPEYIARVVTYLAGPGSEWIRGVDIPVDGGLRAMREAAAAEREQP